MAHRSDSLTKYQRRNPPRPHDSQILIVLLPRYIDSSSLFCHSHHFSNFSFSGQWFSQAYDGCTLDIPTQSPIKGHWAMKLRKTLDLMNVDRAGAVFGDQASRSEGTMQAKENGDEICKLGKHG